MVTIALVGDYSSEVLAHEAIPKALALASQQLGVEVSSRWLATPEIVSDESILTSNADGIWCVPGSPYRSMEGALGAIRFARENEIPFLGTCGGFQHALIEYARSVLHLVEADHSESNEGAALPLIAKLHCALIGKSETIRIYPNTRLAAIYRSFKATEAYQCSYGLNPEFRNHFESSPMEFLSPLRFSAFSEDLEVRAFELDNHPFFIGTLFQPERSAATGQSHPLIEAFLAAANETRVKPPGHSP